MARRFVIGDIHGAYRALIQCLERAGFNRNDDLLICLGDVCDSWPEVNKVLEELLQIENLVLLVGNHDAWALRYFLFHDAPDIWLRQGGEATLRSYGGTVPRSHIELLQRAKLYWLLENKLFVHGGITPQLPLELQDRHTLIWDRQLVLIALRHKEMNDEINLTGYDEVYVGHTPTIRYGEQQPIRACEVCMMDTGAGWPGGVLTIMDIDTGECAASAEVSRLYTGIKGR